MRRKEIRTLISLSLILLPLPLLAGCSGGTRQVASDSQEAITSQAKETTEPNGPKLIKIDRTIRCSIKTTQDLVLHYDSIGVISNTNDGNGLSYIILHYQVSNAGKEPFSTTTDNFAIVTDDNIKYTPDTEAISAVQAAGLVAEGESHELINTRLQPGLQANLFTAFILPTSILSKHLTLLGVGDNSTLLRLSLPIGNTQVESNTLAQSDDSTKPDQAKKPPVEKEVDDESQSSKEEQHNIQEISEPASAVVAHFVNIANKDYKAAYNDFSDEWKSKQPYSEFVSSAQKTEWMLCNRPENCVLRDKTIDPNHAEVDLEMSGFSMDEAVVRFSLICVDGNWKITKGKKVTDAGGN